VEPDAGRSGADRQRSEAFGVRGMVCSAHPAAAIIGIGIMQRAETRSTQQSPLRQPRVCCCR